ncbi:SRPBCC domain-containing protein [Geodermatophilus sp. YIM 151500]|uniref:SRPBCC domain-containing protein n=1 Tax=Geodermatophilus sp. YIM 151500 TaxID=2984531 RepID=UPI0021E3B0AF|nr:SRPBCC domain-containing protein [Geodermatophilus sp. YIM 151500]MCV2490532.1 SRPBCC domain-containing protein [Geodermatophilus sp. YIM 151500]
MRSYEAACRIDASADEVWRRLVAVGSWRDWDSGVDRVEGRVALGERLTIYATMIRSRPFSVTVTELRPAEAMRWRGGLPFGLAVIERTYHLDAQDDGATVLTVREDHTGPLAPLVDRTSPDLNPSFRQFCAGIKALAEGRTSRPAT